MNNVYLYDQELSSRRHQKFLEQLETRLTDLGIGGKICRLGPMTRVEQTVRQELAKKPKTIIVVGSDALASRVAGVMANTKIPLAIVPIGGNLVADAFGVDLKNACRVLAARRIVNLDLGQIDEQHTFVCRASIVGVEPLLSLDGKLSVTAAGKVTIEIINIVGDQYGYRGARPLPDDGRLNVYILKTEKGIIKKEISQSAFICKQLNLIRGAMRVTLDDALEIAAAKEIKVLPKALTAIVGRERIF